MTANEPLWVYSCVWLEEAEGRLRRLANFLDASLDRALTLSLLQANINHEPPAPSSSVRSFHDHDSLALAGPIHHFF